MFWRRRKGSDFSAEIRSHIAMETDRLRAEGLSEADARATASREFGSPTISEERFFESSPSAWLETLFRDLRYAVRVLRKAPAFTLVAVGSLALGIGANTAIFQLLDAVLLRMLPVRNPQELVQLRLPEGSKTRGSHNHRDALTYPIWEQIRSRQQALSEVFAWGVADFDLATSGEPRMARGMLVSGELFSALGIQPAVGRLFSGSDDRPNCGLPGAVISYAFWQRQFGGQRNAVGGKLTVNRYPVEIVGVTPPEFFGMEVGQSFDIALPVCSQAVLTGTDLAAAGTNWWLVVMGRMRPGASLERVNSYFHSLSAPIFTASLPARYPPVSVKDYLALQLIADPAGTGVSDLRADYSEPLYLLLAIAGTVLLIACANLTNLMLARSNARGREIAVRLAIGSSRGRLVRQLMAESLVISVTGAALGLIVARSLSRLLVALLGTQGNEIFVNLDPDWRVMAFAGALAIVTGVLFGLAPALRSTSQGLAEVLKSAGRGSTAGRDRFGMRRLLVVLQVALSLVLVVSALLFSGTLSRLSTINTGFRSQQVLVAQVAFGLLHLSPDRIAPFRQQLMERLRAVPGVTAAADTDTVPLIGNSTSNAVWMDGTMPTQARECRRSHIGPGYFDALSTPILAGRAIDNRDTANSPKVAVVNEAFARVLSGGENPVGKRLWVEATPYEPSAAYEIVGLVRNTKYGDLREDFPPIVFQAQSQDPVATPSDWYLIRSPLPMNSLIPAVRESLTAAAPGIRYRFQIFQTGIDDTLVQERLMASLSAAFGILAGLLAAIGLYGVMSYLVTRRRNEIGIRIALGATRWEILAMVLRESGVLLAAGVLAGCALSLIATRAVATLLFGVKAADLQILLAAAGLLALVGLGASYVPARRAANLDPTIALRDE